MQEDQQLYKGNDQQCSTVDEHSKNKLPDTPSMNIRDPQTIEEIPKIHLQACSKSSKLVEVTSEDICQDNIPKEDVHQDNVPEGKTQ